MPLSKLRHIWLLSTIVALAIAGANAFVVPVSKARVSPSQLSQSSTTANEAANDVSYGEQGRKYRRTVYTHDDWVKHRSADRFFRNLRKTFSSGVYRSVLNEIAATTTVASFVVVWNMIFGGYTDLDGVQHAAVVSNTWVSTVSLPMTPFTLASPSLGLLLAFRANSSYKRWDEARKNWGMNINHTRDLVRMGVAYYDNEGISPERRTRDLQALSLATWSFVRAMKRHLSPEEEDEEDFKKEMYEKLPKEQAQAIIDAAHRPNRALFDLSVAIENLPMHFLRKNEIHSAVTIFEDNLGSSERLLTSPIPLFYSRHTARFLSAWLLLLPFALYEPFDNTWNHLGIIPATAVISVCLFGIEELATQLEEPFTILPMQAFCDKIYNWCNEIVSWEAGDNGMELTNPALVTGGAVVKEKPALITKTVVEKIAVEENTAEEIAAEEKTVEKKRKGLRSLWKRK